MPFGGWMPLQHLAEGVLASVNPEGVVIAANLGKQKGRWFLIVEGTKGDMIQTRGGPVVYTLTELALNFYRSMTEQSPIMPLYVNQVI